MIEPFGLRSKLGGALVLLTSCSGMPPLVTGSWSMGSTTNGKQPQVASAAAPASQSGALHSGHHRRNQAESAQPKPAAQTQNVPRAATATNQAGCDTICQAQKSQVFETQAANDATERQARIAVTVPPSSEALRNLQASLEKDKAAARNSGLSLSVFTLVKLAEPITLPFCKRPQSFGEALSKPPITCVRAPVRIGAVAEAPLEHPPLTTDESGFPGLPVTQADIQFSEADGGRVLEAILIGGYVTEVTWTVRTSQHRQVEEDLLEKFKRRPSDTEDVTCRNGYGVPTGTFSNLTWSFKDAMTVEYEPVGNVCETTGVVGEGFVLFRMATYQRMARSISDAKNAKRPHI